MISCTTLRPMKAAFLSARFTLPLAALLLSASLLAVLAACQRVESPPAPRPTERSAAARAPGTTTGLVVKARSIRVQDGDSFVARLEDGSSRTIRLSGIDAPERSQALADPSRRNLQRLLEDRELRVHVAKKDPYDRWVAQVFVSDGGTAVDVGLEQIESGLAWFYRHYRTDLPPESRERYAQAEQAARSASRGLWQAGRPEPPWEFRRRQPASSLAPPVPGRPAPASAG
jgi:endonuclease YncB( thermonuclease family)